MISVETNITEEELKEYLKKAISEKLLYGISGKLDRLIRNHFKDELLNKISNFDVEKSINSAIKDRIEKASSELRELMKPELDELYQYIKRIHLNQDYIMKEIEELKKLLIKNE